MKFELNKGILIRRVDCYSYIVYLLVLFISVIALEYNLLALNIDRGLIEMI